MDLAGIAETVFKAVEETVGGRMCVNTLSHLFNFTEDAQTMVRLILGLRNNARKNGLTALFVMDEGAQERVVEENVKSICDYVLTTCIKNNERRIRISKAATKHGLEWHRGSF